MRSVSRCDLPILLLFVAGDRRGKIFLKVTEQYEVARVAAMGNYIWIDLVFLEEGRSHRWICDLLTSAFYCFCFCSLFLNLGLHCVGIRFRALILVALCERRKKMHLQSPCFHSLLSSSFRRGGGRRGA